MKWRPCQAADKLTLNSSKKKKRRPYTPDFIAAVRQHMDLGDPLDPAVFACLTSCFYASARLGEFTVRTLSSFSPNSHITPRNLSYDQDGNGPKVAVLHLPKTKMAGIEGRTYIGLPKKGTPTRPLLYKITCALTTPWRRCTSSSSRLSKRASRSPRRNSGRGSAKQCVQRAWNPYKVTELESAPP